MAALNSFQRIDRVLSGLPWGDGATGSATVSSDPNTRATITGTAGQTTGTAGSTAFANGDLVVLHQTQGTGAGQWEINRVQSGGGTTSLTFQVAHNYTYGTGAQIIKVPRYTTATVSAHSVTAWNGTTGGVEVICGRTSIVCSGALNGVGLGYRGGTGGAGVTAGGEGSLGYGNRTGGAAGGASEAGGSGGGYGTNGSQAGTGLNIYGLAYGAADLTTVTPGGSGGGASTSTAPQASGGGSGSLIILISRSITLSSTISANGGAGAAHGSSDRGGGGGSGGAILFVCDSATLGTNNATATGGARGDGVDANAH